MAKESYQDLIFQLGDLAREHLADAPRPPSKMELVYEMEDALVAAREGIEGLEAEMNQEDAAYADFLDRQDAEKAEQKAIVSKWKSAVAGVEVRSRDLKKSLSSQKAAHRYQKISMKRAEERHKELEQREGHDVRKIMTSKENLKKQRLHLMREMRHLEEMEYELNSVLTPRPGQPGAQGILAHKRILEMEDEADDRKAEHEEKMKDLDAAIVKQEEDIKAAEEDLDGALYELGEEAYADRIAHPKLNPLYPRLDKAQ